MNPLIANEGSAGGWIGAAVGVSVVGSPLVGGAGNSLLVASPSNAALYARGALAIGTADFTVEGFLSIVGTSSATFFDATAFALSINGSLKFTFTSTTTGALAGTTTRATGTTYHWALTREGTTLRLFLDGGLEGTGTYPASIADGHLWIGSSAAGSSVLNASHDEVRVTVGVARYTAPFTPPSAKFGRNSTDDPQFANVTALFGFDDDTLTAPTLSKLASPRVVGRPGYRSDGRIVGSIALYGTPNVPVRRRVFALREADMRIVASTWSDPTTGAYVLTGLDPDRKYTVISYDAPRAYRAVIADAVTPELWAP